jgi:hypothetical protein
MEILTARLDRPRLRDPLLKEVEAIRGTLVLRCLAPPLGLALDDDSVL